VVGRDMYPTHSRLWTKHLYRCTPCDAHVGCHPNTTTPLGTLANRPLRAARMAAHTAFDKLWQGGDMPRWAAYKWLRGMMNMPRDECHIGQFDETQCAQAIAHVQDYLRRKGKIHRAQTSNTTVAVPRPTIASAGK